MNFFDVIKKIIKAPAGVKIVVFLVIAIGIGYFYFQTDIAEWEGWEGFEFSYASEESSREDVSLEVCIQESEYSFDQEVLEYVEKAFKEVYPDVTLGIELIPDDVYAYEHKLELMIEADALADVHTLNTQIMRNAFDFYYQDVFEDLTPLIAADSSFSVDNYIAAAFLPQQGEQLIWLPADVIFTHAMFVNGKVLDSTGVEPPKNYSELKDMVSTWQNYGYGPVVMSNTTTWVMSSCLFSTILGRLSGRGWIQKAIAGEYSFKDPVFVDSLEMLKAMFDDGVVSMNTFGLNYGDHVAVFYDNNEPFMIDGSWQAYELESNLPVEGAGYIRIGVLPALPGEVYSDSASVAPGGGLGMKAGLTGIKREAAWTFIKLFTGEEASRIRLTRDGFVPTYKLDISEFKDARRPMLFEIAAMQRSNKPIEVVDLYLPYMVNEALENGLYDVIHGVKTPFQVASQVEEAMEYVRSLE